MGGRNYDKFHGGMEGEILVNSTENQNMSIRFDDQAPGSEPISVAYRHLEYAPKRGGYRNLGAGQNSGSGYPSANKPKDDYQPIGPLVDEHEGRKTGQLVQICGLKAAPELNGRLGRLKKYDEGAGRWECEVRNFGLKRPKPENIMDPEKPVVPTGLSIEELKAKGNEHFKEKFPAPGASGRSSTFRGFTVRLFDMLMWKCSRTFGFIDQASGMALV